MLIGYNCVGDRREAAALPLVRVLCLLVALTLISPGMTADAAQLVKAMRAAYMSDGRRVKIEQVDYDALAAALPQALKIAKKPGALWMTVPIHENSNTRGIRYFYQMQQALRVAARAAPVPGDKERWLRAEMDVVLRYLRDPKTRQIWAQKKDPQDDASLYNQIVTTSSLTFGESRWGLGVLGFLRPDEWGMLRGLEWVDAKGAVIKKGAVVFVERTALAAVGIPVQTSGGAAVTVVGGRRCAIPLGAETQAGAGVGFLRPGGKVYLPIKEYDRQGLYQVSVHAPSQTVTIGTAMKPR